MVLVQMVDVKAGAFGWVANGACEQVTYIFRSVFAVPADGFFWIRFEVVTAFDGQSFTDGAGDGGGGCFEAFGTGSGGCPLPPRAVFFNEHFPACDTAFSFHGLYLLDGSGFFGRFGVDEADHGFVVFAIGNVKHMASLRPSGVVGVDDVEHLEELRGVDDAAFGELQREIFFAFGLFLGEVVFEGGQGREDDFSKAVAADIEDLFHVRFTFCWVCIEGSDGFFEDHGGDFITEDLATVGGDPWLAEVCLGLPFGDLFQVGYGGGLLLFFCHLKAAVADEEAELCNDREG